MEYKKPVLAAAALGVTIALAGCSSGPVQTDTSSSATADSTATGTTSTVPTSIPASPAPGSSTSAPSSAVVAGFPTKLIPTMPGSTVQSTALDRTQPLATASFVAKSPASTAAIAAYYAKVYKDQGFTALPPSKVGNVTSLSFTRASGKETVNVSLGPADGGVTINIGAHVLPASLK